MFARVLTVLDSRADHRDALVLGAQLTDEDGTLLVAHVLQTVPVPLHGTARDVARRRTRLSDCSDEVYATLGPDPRVHYLPVSGLLLADAAIVLAQREQAQAIVIGQNLLTRGGGDARDLVARAPCPVAVAPYGHRFGRGSALARIALACTDDDVSAMLREARTPVLLLPGAGAALRLNTACPEPKASMSDASPDSSTSDAVSSPSSTSTSCSTVSSTPPRT
jgi:hypothetical protein